jgi:hypothetical protein
MYPESVSFNFLDDDDDSLEFQEFVAYNTAFIAQDDLSLVCEDTFDMGGIPY